jgi:predicted nucleotidyltransferase
MVGLSGYHADSQGQSSSLDTEAARRFDITLFSALDALDKNNVSYAIIGGIAASGMGRPRSTQDIDLFVRPEDAEAILEVLSKHGFRTEQTNPTWLFKAFKENVLVDIIFRSEGGFYYDDEMRERTFKVYYHGRQIPIVSPEDFILIKCAVHSEEGPHHWHDALSVLSYSKVDWDYLLHRARKAPRRLLALLMYAQSDDIWVPNNVIQKLYQNIFGEPLRTGGGQIAQAPKPTPAAGSQPAKGTSNEAYLGAQIREALATNEEIGALDVDIWVEGLYVLVRGRCQTNHHHDMILKCIKKLAPNYEIRDQMQINDWQGPTEVKEIV